MYDGTCENPRGSALSMKKHAGHHRWSYPQAGKGLNSEFSAMGMNLSKVQWWGHPGGSVG